MLSAHLSKNPSLDPYAGQVSYLAHFNGTNGQTTQIDKSLSPKTITFNNGAAISTAQSKFNGSSLLLDGVNDNVTNGTSSAFTMGTGQFTIEFFYRPLTDYSAGNNYIMDLGANGTVISLTSNHINFVGTGGVFVLSGTNGAGIPTNVWYHLAVTRNASNRIDIWLDGVSIANTTNGANLTDTACFIGGFGGGGYAYNGYLAEFRITKGVCRYASSFTPPTAALPNP